MSINLQIDGPRACRPAEVPAMIAMTNGVMRENSDQSFLTDYPLVYQENNLQNVQIIKVGNDVASVVPFIPKEIYMENCRFKIGIISPTATAPAHRKKGYALKCLNNCIEKMERENIDLSVLWTLVPTFNFYAKADFQGVRSQGWIYSFLAEDAKLFKDHGEEVVKYNPNTQEYITDIQAMHEKETYGVLRSSSEYPVLFNLPKMTTFLAMRAGKPTAYLLFSNATNKPGILEAGGDKQAIETLINYTLGNLNSSSKINAFDNLTPTNLGEILFEKMPNRRQPMTAGPMMIRINNVSGFFGKIKSLLYARNAGAKPNFSIEIQDNNETISLDFSNNAPEVGSKRLGQHFELTRKELTSIIFGAHPERPIDVPERMKGLFPIYFPIWMLDHS